MPRVKASKKPRSRVGLKESGDILYLDFFLEAFAFLALAMWNPSFGNFRIKAPDLNCKYFFRDRAGC